MKLADALETGCDSSAADLAEIGLVTPRTGPYTLAIGHAPVGVTVVCSLGAARALAAREANESGNIVPVRIAGGGRVWDCEVWPSAGLDDAVRSAGRPVPRTGPDDEPEAGDGR
ncbi:MAG: hypothetical protein HY816_20220 [Candidatus Wallbacteria bacterium]|nr:hypothetical protein [Candidatus Wallbacteria bacterium]